MTDISVLEQKIVALKRKKEQLHLKAAHDLYKQLSTLLGTHFSPELVMGMVQEQTTLLTPQQQHKWQQLGATFFRTSPITKVQKTATDDQPIRNPTSAESTQNET